MTTLVTAPVDSEQLSRSIRVATLVARGYSRVFAASPVAGALSPQRPVRRTGFDLDLVVRRRVVEADGVVSLELSRAEDDALPRWIPGAHLDVFLPSGKQRQYSLCGNPSDLTSYRIAVRRIADGGGGSREVHDDLREGDVLRVRGPRNAFQLVDADSYLFVAGGIGITPILAMVGAAAPTGATCRVVYLGRDRSSLPFLGELEALRDQYGVHLDVRPDDEVGLPDMADILAQADPGASIYLCGPVPLQEAARRLLPELNPTAFLHTERFSPLPVVGGREFTATLGRSGKTITVAADESLLTAVRRELPDVKYSCQQGFCGSCKVGVLKGDVEHRTAPPGDPEPSMLICVSRCAGDELELDL